MLECCVFAVEECARRQDADVAALVLTGSFSRGEGSVLQGSSGVTRILGDIEFFVVLNHGADFSSNQKVLLALSAEVEQLLDEQQIVCNVEFSAVSRNYFRNVKPSIFNYELQRHGKVVLGDAAILSEIPIFTSESIPLVDGFYLLCNRIVEQLIAAKSLRDQSFDIRYQIVKLYLDMAGSFLVVSGRYAPTYAERVILCPEAINADNVMASTDRSQQFAHILETATAYKLNPSAVDCPLMGKENSSELQWQFFKEAASFCKDIWQWETKRLFGASKNIDDWTLFANRNFTLRAIIREWLKFFIIAHRSGCKVSPTRAIRQFSKGTPRTLIYAAAVELYFSLAEDREIDVRKIEQLLPVPCRLSSPEEAIDAVIEAWNTFVRSA